MGSTTATRERVRRSVTRIVHQGFALPELTGALGHALRLAIPFEGICWVSVDPATLLPTGETVENALPAAVVGRLIEIELLERDFNKFTALARGDRPAASLSDATEGDLDRSLRQRELRQPSGFEDELRVVLSDDTGTWGALTLLRETARPLFTSSEVRFVASVAAQLAGGLRHAALLGDGRGGGIKEETGLLVLAPDNTVEMANRAADGWLDLLEVGARTAAELPIVVQSVAARTRRVSVDGERRDADFDNGVAQARARTCRGDWVLVRGSALGEGSDSRVAILLEAARAPELAPLIVDAFGFTERERRVTELIAQGYSTRDISDQLHLSMYTVQDHLKSIFTKSGTSSRGELVARLFFDHYLPRLTSSTSEN